MESKEIRKKFLKFFEARGHKIAASSSLLSADPSVLLTSAGMQQFKPYFVGNADALADFGSQRTASCQKCFRTSDIDEVGDDMHLTFFEMLGNFSFGSAGDDNPVDYGTIGYFKRAAIHWAYQFFLSNLNLDKANYFITVFNGDSEVPFDEESYNIWKNEIQIPEEKIKKFGKEDNFWGPTGIEGPCGPTTEIHINNTEIWNLVFNEFYEYPDGRLEKLQNPGVDTGMGLERLAMILQNKNNIFETDLFVPLMQKIEETAPRLDFPPKADSPSAEKIKRIFCDHARAIVFLLADGVLPSNKEAGYVLRRLIRRLIAYENIYKINGDLISELAEIVIKNYGNFYSELSKNENIIKEQIILEKNKFGKALTLGIGELNKIEKIAAKEAFYLYETFGLPYELIIELASQKIRDLKKEDFEEELKKHQEISRAGQEKKFGGHGIGQLTTTKAELTEEELYKIKKLHTTTHLLHAALRQVLGGHVQQMGSDINSERLRFDFKHFQKMTPEEIQKIEEIINEKIKENLPVLKEEMSYEDAIKSGALAFFREKYPFVVMVYTINNPSTSSGPPFSREICGGPHAENTSELGHFRILKEESSSAGVRRIKAVLE